MLQEDSSSGTINWKLFDGTGPVPPAAAMMEHLLGNLIPGAAQVSPLSLTLNPAGQPHPRGTGGNLASAPCPRSHRHSGSPSPLPCAISCIVPEWFLLGASQLRPSCYSMATPSPVTLPWPHPHQLPSCGHTLTSYPHHLPSPLLASLDATLVRSTLPVSVLHTLPMLPPPIHPCPPCYPPPLPCFPTPPDLTSRLSKSRWPSKRGSPPSPTPPP